MNLAEKLRLARTAKDMSQKELALAAGITERTVQNYELGASVPKKRETYAKLAEALGVREDVLLDDEASFVLSAGAAYGARGRRLAEEIVDSFRVAAAGGEIDDDDLDFIKDAMLQTYRDAKAYNQRYRNKRYSSADEK